MSIRMNQILSALDNPVNAEARALLPLYIEQSAAYIEENRKYRPTLSDKELRLDEVLNMLLPKMQHVLERPKSFPGCRDSRKYLNALLAYDFEYSKYGYENLDGEKSVMFDFSEEEFDALKAYAEDTLKKSMATLATIK